MLNHDNDARDVVGLSVETVVLSFFIQTPSTWAMMLVGLAGLTFAGYRQAKQAHSLRESDLRSLAVSGALSDGIEVGGVVIPAHAGIQGSSVTDWMPAFAGMTP